MISKGFTCNTLPITCKLVIPLGKGSLGSHLRKPCMAYYVKMNGTEGYASLEEQNERCHWVLMDVTVWLCRFIRMRSAVTRQKSPFTWFSKAATGMISHPCIAEFT